MKLWKRIFLGGMVLVLVGMFSGCGYPELYERVLIHGIGVDWDGQNYRVTVRSSISAEDEGEELFVCQGSTVLEALSSLSLSTGRDPFYAHNYLVVFGMECAQRGLDQCLDFFVRYYNTRPAVKLFLAENTAEEVLSSEKDGKLMRMSELQALGSGGRYNGQVADVDILDFVNSAKGEGESPVLPVLRATDSGVEVAATGYFSGTQIKGFLSLEQTRGYLAALGKLEHGELAVFGEQLGSVTLSLRNVEGEIQAGLREAPDFQISIQIDADVSAAAGNHEKEREFYPALEAAAAQLLREEAASAIEQSAVRDGCDIFGFGRRLYRHYTGFWQENSQDWPQILSQCHYEVEVNVKVRRLEEENLSGWS
ncbi:Ger(x)C family spore germination protein [Acutalibacter sp. 1XD8-33]|uniref:Ger(x)C family spore germination protein n=1 Tax=Acutalibacter sp. 1XD8-33 TaxID=2320081 RepID=UPI001315019D|nr:Ger(x)C family spore germination protein [Acutalibacter sp. 1XD8-33]